MRAITFGGVYELKQICLSGPLTIARKRETTPALEQAVLRSIANQLGPKTKVVFRNEPDGRHAYILTGDKKGKDASVAGAALKMLDPKVMNGLVEMSLAAGVEQPTFDGVQMLAQNMLDAMLDKAEPVVAQVRLLSWSKRFQDKPMPKGVTPEWMMTLARASGMKHKVNTAFVIPPELTPDGKGRVGTLLSVRKLQPVLA